MIEVKVGDVMESTAQTLVNTVNCVGIMGKGIALEFKKRFPEMYKDYVRRCKKGDVKLGQPYIYRELTYPWIINFPTKDHWRSVACLDDIVRGMRYLLDHYKEWGVTSIAVPPLGCGQGQLEWRVVGPSLYRYLNRMDIPVELYAPFGTPPIETQGSFLSSSNEPVIADAVKGSFKLKPDWMIIVEVLARIENEPYHWPVGRTMFQKIAYFATEEGLSTDLNFAQGSYGPFASNLKKHITQLVNNGLVKENRSGEMLRVSIGPTYNDARQSYQSAINDNSETINRIAMLFRRLKTSQAEVAATVHFSANQLYKINKKKPTETQVLSYVMEWKQKRKPPISKWEAAKMIRDLAALGWINVKSSEDLPLPKDDPCEV